MAEEAASTVEQQDPGQGGDPAASTGTLDPVTDGAAASAKPVEAQIDYEKLDHSKIPLERLLEREDLQRHLQSLKDREAARIESKLRIDATARAEQARKTAEATERAQLLEEEDYDALGRRTADQMREDQAFMDAATKISQSVETALKQHPEFRVLGEDAIEQVYDEVRRKGGNIVDFTTALSEKRREHEITTLGAQLRKENREELEALLTERGLGKREAAVQTQETAVAAVSGATASAGQKPLTYEEASLAYGEGNLSWDEFKPFRTQHDKDRKK